MLATRNMKPWTAVVITNPDIEVLYISQLSNPHCVCAEVIAPGFSFYIVSHYFQFNDDRQNHLSHLETVLTSLRGQKVVIRIDSNAESSLWSPRGTNANGANLEQLLLEFNLDLHNKKNEPPTYETENGNSYVDIMISTQSMSKFICNWKVMRSWTNSDHNAIVFRVEASKSTKAEPAATARFNTDKAEWAKFARSLTNISSTDLEPLPLNSSNDVETMAKTLTASLTEACNRSMPRKKRYRTSNPWWTKELSPKEKGRKGEVCV